jgi:hypothetical protein
VTFDLTGVDPKFGGDFHDLRNHSSSSVQSILDMASSSNRFSILKDELDDRGAEDTLVSSASITTEINCKEKKKKKKKTKQPT